MNITLLQDVTVHYILHTFSIRLRLLGWLMLLGRTFIMKSGLPVSPAPPSSSVHLCRARRFVVLPFVTSSLSVVGLSEVFFFRLGYCLCPFGSVCRRGLIDGFDIFAASAHCKPCFWVNKYQYRTSSALSGLSTFLPPLCTPDSWRKSSGFGVKFGNRTLTFNLGPDSQFTAFFFIHQPRIRH